MARTLKKMELEEMLFCTTSLAHLSEIDNVLSPLTFTPGIEDSLFSNDDVYKDLIGKSETGDVSLAPEEFLAGELLDELDLKGK